MGAVHRGEARQVGHQFGVDLDAGQSLCATAVRVFRAKGADQLFNAGIDISTVKCRDPGIGKRDHVFECLGLVHRAMATCQLPAAPDHPGNAVALAKLDAGNGHFCSGNGTAVVSA